jgi:hypothetical protein
MGRVLPGSGGAGTGKIKLAIANVGPGAPPIVPTFPEVAVL